MTIHYGFKPDAHRAKLLDHRMHRELGSSLRYLGQQCLGVVPYDTVALDQLVASLERGERFPPSLFGTYYRLAAALLDQELKRAEELFRQATETRPTTGGQRVLSLQAPATDQQSALYHSLMLEDAVGGYDFLPPTKVAEENFRKSYNDAMALLKRGTPELAAEIAAIVREVVCVTGDASHKLQFDGGSHYQLWGALFLNIGQPRNALELIEVVAHESAHSLLFGFCTDETLVRNPDDELYKSPLRSDKRPMDGIYHATFVSARMHWAMTEMINSGLLDEQDRANAESARTADRENFEAGHQVVVAHADLTQTGRELMKAARDYIEAEPV